MYQIPSKYYFRLHHIRPRFKNKIEDVLFYVAQEIANLKEEDEDVFKEQINRAIKSYPDNSKSVKKTIDNWRTEISSLFGFVVYKNKRMMPGRMAIELAQELDLASFFKKFLFRFQYPGAHITKKSILEEIQYGVHFKPAQYILSVLTYANKVEKKSVALTVEEVCHCIFNDLRCTSDNEGAKKTWERIKTNRNSNVQYDSTGDVIRYAGDILDYMVYANLLKCYDGRHYYLQKLEQKTIELFIKSNEWFSGYDNLISHRQATYQDIDNEYENWFNYVNKEFEKLEFKTNVAVFLSENKEEVEAFNKQLIDNVRSITAIGEQTVSTKQIGDLGENLVIGHECERIKREGRPDLIHLIKFIPTAFAIGYDVSSIEKDERKRCIEVKTTISTRPLLVNQVHLPPNEWNTARSFGERYYVYRLMITKEHKELFIIQDPVSLYNKKKLMVTVENGFKVTYNPQKVGKYEELLEWKASK